MTEKFAGKWEGGSLIGRFVSQGFHNSVSNFTHSSSVLAEYFGEAKQAALLRLGGVIGGSQSSG